MASKHGAASGFDAVKKRLLGALIDGNYQHEARDRIDIKNDLLMGRVTPMQLISIVKRSRGHEHFASAHRADKSITVHVLKTIGWYIKFYFLDPSTVFISVHLEGQS